jgi:hypothetical protein
MGVRGEDTNPKNPSRGGGKLIMSFLSAMEVGPGAQGHIYKIKKLIIRFVNLVAQRLQFATATFVYATSLCNIFPPL